jgi:hypothetical protein
MTDTPRPRDLLIAAARRLGQLRDRVVFVGGATTELLITDPAAAESRTTTDVDVIVEVSSHADYVGPLRNELVATRLIQRSTSSTSFASITNTPCLRPLLRGALGTKTMCCTLSAAASRTAGTPLAISA